MKITSLILTSITGLLLFSTTVCGLWLRSKGVTPEGVSFHVKIALATVAFAVVTIGILLAVVLRK